MKYSVLLLCYKRFQRFEEIIKFWLEQPKVDQVIVWDNSGEFKTDLPITLINSNENLGSGVRLQIINLLRNDRVIFCDDDMILEDGIVEDLEAGFISEDVVLAGVMGKRFEEQDFFKSETFHGADINGILPMHYVPYNLAMIDISNLPDIRSCKDLFHLDDLWLSVELRKSGKSVVIVPSKNYALGPESSDKDALYKNKTLRERRRQYLLSEDMTE